MIVDGGGVEEIGPTASGRRKRSQRQGSEQAIEYNSMMAKVNEVNRPILGAGGVKVVLQSGGPTGDPQSFNFCIPFGARLPPGSQGKLSCIDVTCVVPIVVDDFWSSKPSKILCG